MDMHYIFLIFALTKVSPCETNNLSVGSWKVDKVRVCLLCVAVTVGVCCIIYSLLVYMQC